MRKPIDVLIIVIFLTILVVVVISIMVPGHFVYIGAAATPTPVATPMDVILKLRDANGENEQEWVCKFKHQAGWICEVREETSNGK